MFTIIAQNTMFMSRIIRFRCPDFLQKSQIRYKGYKHVASVYKYYSVQQQNLTEYNAC